MEDRESRKAGQELAEFRKFVIAANLPISPGSERNGVAARGEPDIVCILDGEDAGFELTAACAPEFAAAVTKSFKADNGVGVAFVEDVSAETLRKKLAKHYLTPALLHLVVYRGLTALTDDMIIDRLRPELANGLGPFQGVWYHGDAVHLLAKADS